MDILNNLVLNEWASLTGIGATFSFAADYSGPGSTWAGVSPASDEILVIEEVILVVRTMTAISDLTDFADVTALSNGLMIKTIDNVGGTIQELAPLIHYNMELAAMSDFEVLLSSELMTAKIDIPSNVLISGFEGESLAVTLEDDLSVLRDFKILVKGYYHNKYQ